MHHHLEWLKAYTKIMGFCPPFSTGAGFRNHPQYVYMIIYVYRNRTAWRKFSVYSINSPDKIKPDSFTICIHYLVGGIPTPLKNISQVTGKDYPFILWKVIQFHGSKPPISYSFTRFYMHWGRPPLLLDPFQRLQGWPWHAVGRRGEPAPVFPAGLYQGSKLQKLLIYSDIGDIQ